MRGGGLALLAVACFLAAFILSEAGPEAAAWALLVVGAMCSIAALLSAVRRR